jgi:hypothetical protein
MASKASRLAELRALRASGKTRLSTYEVKEAESLYDEHDEEGYNKVVRARLDRDDFVIDDNGEGYADDGREEWMGEMGYDSPSGSEPELPLKGRAGKFIMTGTAHHYADSRTQPSESTRKIRRKLKRQPTASTNTSTKALLWLLPSPK